MKTPPAPHSEEPALLFPPPRENSSSIPHRLIQDQPSLGAAPKQGTTCTPAAPGELLQESPTHSVSQQQQGKAPLYMDKASNKGLHSVLCTKRLPVILPTHPLAAAPHAARTHPATCGAPI